MSGRVLGRRRGHDDWRRMIDTIVLGAKVAMIEPGAVQTELNDHITDADAKKTSQVNYRWTRWRPRTSPR
ncbi:hypothetical protein APR04_004630 [Promicromonospora umidemergens]|uniref:Uncharacterized protein n=2 Tax=Promicromonospora umidemergens TaxID=629679 RepID=A0ABP8XX95_9MICO|nr:hypothetical protein [Promicromonospora umidemergens]